MSSDAQGLMLGPALLNIFGGHTDSGMECTLSKLAENIELSGVVDTLPNLDRTEVGLCLLHFLYLYHAAFQVNLEKRMLQRWLENRTAVILTTCSLHNYLSLLTFYAGIVQHIPKYRAVLLPLPSIGIAV